MPIPGYYTYPGLPLGASPPSLIPATGPGSPGSTPGSADPRRRRGDDFDDGDGGWRSREFARWVEGGGGTPGSTPGGGFLDDGSDDEEDDVDVFGNTVPRTTPAPGSPPLATAPVDWVGIPPGETRSIGGFGGGGHRGGFFSPGGVGPAAAGVSVGGGSPRAGGGRGSSALLQFLGSGGGSRRGRD